MSTTFKITTHDQLQSALPTRKHRPPLGAWLVAFLLLFCVAGALWVQQKRKATQDALSAPVAAESREAAPGETSAERLPQAGPMAATVQPVLDSDAEDTSRRQITRVEPHIASEEQAMVAQAPRGNGLPPMAPVTAPEPTPAAPTLNPIAVRLVQTEANLTMRLGLPAGEQTRSLQETSARKGTVGVSVSLVDGATVPVGQAAITSWQVRPGDDTVDIVLAFDKTPTLSKLVQLTNARLEGRSQLTLRLATTDQQVSFPFSINPNEASVPIERVPHP